MVGIAPAVEHQVAPHPITLDRAGRVDAGRHAGIGREQGRGEGAHRQFGVAGGQEEAITIPLKQDLAGGIEHHHAPVVPIERRSVQQVIEPLAKRLALEGAQQADQQDSRQGNVA